MQPNILVSEEAKSGIIGSQLKLAKLSSNSDSGNWYLPFIDTLDEKAWYQSSLCSVSLCILTLVLYMLHHSVKQESYNEADAEHITVNIN